MAGTLGKEEIVGGKGGVKVGAQDQRRVGGWAKFQRKAVECRKDQKTAVE